MKLTATPFDAQTGELLPVYRDAYLRGDLARSSAQAVENYLRRDASEAHSVVTRWHQIQSDEVVAAAPGWVGKQMQFIREQPQRFRRRALSMVTVCAMLAGASMAANRLPASSLPAVKLSTSAMSASAANMASAPMAMAAEASMSRTMLLHGRILNEKGQPMAGATVMHKGTSNVTSTDADGNYSLRVPANSRATLQYGYGGYTEQEMQASSVAAVAPVVLQPKATKRHHWLFF
jgi:hypothetical protein